MPMSRSAWEDSTPSSKEQPEKKESIKDSIRKKLADTFTPAPIKKIVNALDKK